MKQLESRKYTAFILSFLATCLGLATGKLSDDHFTTLIPIILAIYVSANVAQKYAQRNEDTYV